MSKILVIDGASKFAGVGGTLNHSYAILAEKTLRAMDHEVTVTRVEDDWKAAEEAAKINAADAVILQFAAWWMSVPWQVKKYMDEVFCAGLSNGDGRSCSAPKIGYGTGGKLSGCYMLSVTWNAPANAFTDKDDFFGGVGIDGVILPVHKAFQFIGLKPLETFMANDVVKNPTHEADFARFEEVLKRNFG